MMMAMVTARWKTTTTTTMTAWMDDDVVVGNDIGTMDADVHEDSDGDGNGNGKGDDDGDDEGDGEGDGEGKGDGDSDGDGNGNGDSDGNGVMDDGGRQRRQRLAPITTINLPFDMKVAMYWQSRAPPSMRAQQGSLVKMLRPTTFSIFGFPTCGSL